MVHQQDLGLTTTQLLGLLKPSRSGQMHDWPMQNLINCMLLDNKVKLTTHTYTPVLTASTTDPSIGNGNIDGRYLRLANSWILALGRFRFGSTSTFGSGEYRVSLPVAGDPAFHEVSAFDTMGSFFWRDNSNSAGGRLGMVDILSPDFDTVRFFYGIGTGDTIQHDQPVAQADSDALAFYLLYKEVPVA